MIVKRSSKLLILCSTWVLVGSCGLTQKSTMAIVYPPLSALEKDEIKYEEEKMRNIEKLKNTLTVLGELTDSAERADAGFFLKLADERYNTYKPVETVISKLLASDKSQILIEVFGGNWCSDTHAGVPELCKVLDLCGVDSYQFEYHRVSRDKMLVDGQSRSFEIGSVPLVRIYKVDSEGQRILLGEIVEMPRESWEADLLKLVGGSR